MSKLKSLILIHRGPVRGIFDREIFRQDGRVVPKCNAAPPDLPMSERFLTAMKPLINNSSPSTLEVSHISITAIGWDLLS